MVFGCAWWPATLLHDNNFIVAHCFRHGTKVCRLTRTLRGSTNANRKAQGRPLGLCVAWLAAADHPDWDTPALHKKMDHPDLDARMQARAKLAGYENSDAWFALERCQREDEEEEPEVAP